MPTLVARPSTSHKIAFVALVTDFEAHDAEHVGPYAAAKQDFARYVQELISEEQGIGLRKGWVPCTHRWLVEPGGAVAGVWRLRHHIDTPFLASEGGHIGYDVAPSWRKKGFGHLALETALREAAGHNLDRVLLIANESNTASRRVIEAHGGELEAIVFSEYWKQPVCRYWIPVAK
jgi:predicted acetyltransferase